MIPSQVANRTAAHGFWVLIASLLGYLIATQPVNNVIELLAVLVLVLLAIITPLTPLVALLILAPLRTLIATEAPSQFPFDIGQVGFAGFLLSYALFRAVRQQQIVNFTWTPLYLLLGIFLVLSGLSAFNATSLTAWLNEWLKWAQMVVLIGLVMNLADAGKWQWLIFGLIAAGLANALIGGYEFLGGSGALHLAINDRFFRAFGTFGQPNPFGGFMGLLLPLALMATLGYGLRLWRQWQENLRIDRVSCFAMLFYLVASIILLVGIAVSWSRGAWLGFIASLAVLALALPRKASQSAVLIVLLATFLTVVLSTGLLPQSVINRVNSATEEYFTFTDVRGVNITSDNYPVVERLAHWQAALAIASSHPWLGVGLGNYEAVYPDYRLINWHFPLGHAHNYYLNILAEAGIIGLLGYGKLWLGTLWLTWRARQHPDPLARLVAIGLLGSWIYLSVHSLFDNLYVNNLFVHIGLMLGLLAVLYNQTWKHHKVGI